MVFNSEIDFARDVNKLLSDDELFTLAVIAINELITPDEHALIFRQEINQSMHLLSSMRNRGLLVQTKAGFSIHFLLYKVIIKLLHDKHYIA